MSTTLLGELAALLASVGFTLGPTFYTLAGQRIGSRHTLYMRLLISTWLLMVAHWVYAGSPYPAWSPRAWLWLLLSGAVGLALADIFLFEAFVRIGPRLSMLVLTAVPVFSTLMAWWVLGEQLTLSELAWMTLVLTGIAWVVLWGQRPSEASAFRVEARGLLMAFLAAFLSAVSALWAKVGMMGTDIHPVAANLLRMTGGMLALWLPGCFLGRVRRLARDLQQHPRVLVFLLVGSLAGPVVGMSLQMFAYQTVPLGIALTLTSLPPVWLLPVGRLLFREQLTVHAVLGTVLAVVGVVGLLG